MKNFTIIKGDNRMGSWPNDCGNCGSRMQFNDRCTFRVCPICNTMAKVKNMEIVWDESKKEPEYFI